MPAKTLQEKIIEADERAAHWLAEGNAASEKGKLLKSEILFSKAQFWLDRANKLRGDS